MLTSFGRFDRAERSRWDSGGNAVQILAECPLSNDEVALRSRLVTREDSIHEDHRGASLAEVYK
jgi:hypothetical protein